MNTLLTQEQVNGLEDGTIVEVIWAGGNGPHAYEIGKKNGASFALITRDNPHGKRQREDWEKGYADADWILKNVGSDQRQTWVRLPGPREEWPHRTLTWRSDGKTSCPNCDGECQYADHKHNQQFVSHK